MSKISDAQQILKALGLPKEQQNEMSALTLLALCNIGPNSAWNKAERTSTTISKGIMAFISEKYGKKYAPNTRETFRRHVLHQFVQAKIADYNPDNPELPTNSPKAHYAISTAAFKIIREWGNKKCKLLCEEFKRQNGNLLEIYQGKKKSASIPVDLEGETFKLSPGRHNELQIAVIKEFAPRFAPAAKILYFGDTANKSLFFNRKLINSLSLNLSKHDKLPDIMLYDTKRKWFFLIEVVTSHGPMSAKRVFELKKMFSKYSIGVVFVSAFPDFETFRKHLKNIAWETEVWISEIPDHLIHYNGNKFLVPY
jgi:type II restriction enzyme